VSGAWAAGRSAHGLEVIKARNQARARATSRLVEAHRAEFEQLLHEEAGTPGPVGAYDAWAETEPEAFTQRGSR
jgi:hypothetical protein